MMEKIYEYIRQFEEKKIIVCGTTLYHILITIMIINECKCSDRLLLFLFSYKKKEIEEFEKMKHNLAQYGIKTHVFDKKSAIFRLIKVTDIRMIREYRNICREFDKKENFLFINFAWSFKRIHFPASMFFKKCQNAIFIQDGATQYLYPRESLAFLVFKKVYDGDDKFWDNMKLHKIYVEHPEKYPMYMQNKIESFSMKGTEICNSTINMIENIFSINDSTIKNLKSADGIIFTQPLSEDGLVSEKRKLNIYKELVEFYCQYGHVCLKVHPRDYSDYKDIEVPIINDRFPSELLSVLGIHFSFAVGLFTSAIDTVDADYRFNLGKDFPQNTEFEMISL